MTPGTEQLLQIFIVLAGVLLIPVVVALTVVLFKLAFLVHSVSELVATAKQELAPLIKELRLIVGHVEEMGQKASQAVKDVGSGLGQIKPFLSKSFRRFRVSSPRQSG